MFTIEFIAPYKNLVATVETAFAEHPKREEIKHVVNFKGVPEIRRSTLVGDIFIARGLTASYLNQLWKDATVIELPMSGYDILRAMSEGVRLHGSKSIAPLDEVEPIIRKAVSDGADLIIGGNSVTIKAKAMGLCAQRIEVGKESVRQAIDEAWRLWHSNIEERGCQHDANQGDG